MVKFIGVIGNGWLVGVVGWLKDTCKNGLSEGEYAPGSFLLGSVDRYFRITPQMVLQPS